MLLEKGPHRGLPGGCLMEIVSLVDARRIVIDGTVHPDWLWRGKTDDPPTICRAVSLAGRRVNDAMNDDDRWVLGHLLPRLVRARRRDDDIERRITWRLAAWAARSVLDRVADQLVDRAERNITLAESALWQTPSDHLERSLWAWEPGAGQALWVSAWAVQDPLQAISASAAQQPDDALASWLSDLIDAHTKAVVEEGAYSWEPEMGCPPDDEIGAVVTAIVGHH